jgi:peptide/nickel transport system substrate-binding protein
MRPNLLCCVAALLALLPAFRPAAQTIIFIPQADPGVLDPVVNSSYIAMEHGYMVYDTLLAMDAQFTPRPQMLDHVDISADGRTYSLVLRDGLVFSDGAPVRAADAIASIRRWAARDASGRMLLNLGMTLTESGERSFTLSLREPWGATLDSLAKVSGITLFVMKEQDAMTPPTTPVGHIIGSGPFRFVADQYVPASRLVYERNPTYVPRSEPPSFYAGGKRVAVDRVEWHIIPDPATSAAALISREADIWETPPFDLVAMLKADANLAVRNHNAAAMAYMRPNFLYPPFDKVEARQALLHLVDQRDFMEAVFGTDPTSWQVCWAWLGCGTPTGTEAGTEALAQPDLAEARRLLAAAGYSGQTVILLEPTDQPVLFALSEVAAARLKQAGVAVQVKAMNWATLVALRNRQDPPDKAGWNLFFTWTFTLDLAPPLTNAALAAPCDRSNYAGWPCDAAIEALRSAWGKAADSATRRQLAEQLQQRAVEFVPYVPVGQYSVPIAYQKDLHDFLEVPLPVMWSVHRGG